MAKKRGTGEGSIYLRKDGRWEAAAYFLTTAGTRKRRRFYGKTRREVHEKLIEAQAQAAKGALVPISSMRVDDYLDNWLEQIVRPARRPKTYDSYEKQVRLHIKPGLGQYALHRLTVQIAQRFFNQLLSEGSSARTIHAVREVLSSALSRAQREELITRNVARLVDLPRYERADIHPWSPAEAKAFLDTAGEVRLYPAFVLLTYYGVRLGEVLGIRWSDVDGEAGVLRIRQQIQRVGGELVRGPLKTRAGRRDLPLLPTVAAVLENWAAQQAAERQAAASEWLGEDGPEALVFTTQSGLPVEPRNLSRSFHRVCEIHGLRRIKVHHLRHTAGTFLKDLGVPARDAQIILGHSQISVTQEIYQHGSLATSRQALERVEQLLSARSPVQEESQASRQNSRQNKKRAAVSPWDTGLLPSIFGADRGIRTHDPLFTKQPL